MPHPVRSEAAVTRNLATPTFFTWSRRQLQRWFKQQTPARRKVASMVSGEILESRQLLSAVAAEVAPMTNGTDEASGTTTTVWDVEFCEEVSDGLIDSHFVSVELVDGRLEIDGSRYDDSIVVDVLAEITLLGDLHGGSDSGERHLVVGTGGESFWTGDYDEVESIRFLGRSGDDRFDNRTDIPVAAFGGDGNDVLVGGDGDDILSGGVGNDVIEGGRGDDELNGGDGRDVLSGNLGADMVRGGRGRDTISGGNGSDSLLGEAGNDEVDGDGGSDFIFGGDGRDVLSGGRQQDTIYGGNDRDILYGGTGNDVLYGNSGNDSLEGGRGRDSLYGNDGIDVLDGGAAQDLLRGGSDSDYLYGGNGQDNLYGEDGDDVIHGQGGDDYLDGGSGDDHLEGDDGDDRLYGRTGDDYLEGNSGDDVLHGASGEDRLYGRSGADVLWGGPDDDRLDGGSGNDVLHGGKQDDSLWGGSGDDDLYGDAGDDLLRGQDGDDGVYGGSGDDSLYGGNGQDRFLYMAWTSEPQDASREDAKLRFSNGTRDWLESEIEEIDSALAVLHRATGDDTLLETSWGNKLTFSRDHADGASFARNNDFTNTITFYDGAFYQSSNGLRKTVFHEIGHNWDNENPGWSEFKDLSGWNWQAADTSPGDGYCESTGDNNWWHHSSAGFAREYGRDNPYEDFATTFGFYFIDASGSEYREFSGDADNAETQRRLGDKYDFMADWIRTL